MKEISDKKRSKIVSDLNDIIEKYCDSKGLNKGVFSFYSSSSGVHFRGSILPEPIHVMYGNVFRKYKEEVENLKFEIGSVLYDASTKSSYRVIGMEPYSEDVLIYCQKDSEDYVYLKLEDAKNLK